MHHNILCNIFAISLESCLFSSINNFTSQQILQYKKLFQCITTPPPPFSPFPCFAACFSLPCYLFDAPFPSHLCFFVASSLHFFLLCLVAPCIVVAPCLAATPWLVASCLGVSLFLASSCLGVSLCLSTSFLRVSLCLATSYCSLHSFNAPFPSMTIMPTRSKEPIEI